jgi:hypothetical protein
VSAVQAERDRVSASLLGWAAVPAATLGCQAGEKKMSSYCFDKKAVETKPIFAWINGVCPQSFCEKIPAKGYKSFQVNRI